MKGFTGVQRWFYLTLGIAMLFGGLTPASRATNLDLLTAPNPPLNAPASANGDSCFPVISDDGRFVLFGSTADNLALNASNTQYRVVHPIYRNLFLFDRNLGSSVMVSSDFTEATGGNDNSTPMAVSTNGQFALFESAATNLVAGDTNRTSDIFRRDLTSHLTALVSLGTSSECANGPSTDATMTPDGRYIAFSSRASNLVPGDANGISDVFFRDMTTSTNVLVSIGAQSAALKTAYAGVAGSDLPEITPNGRFVAYLSTATNLVPGITNVGEIYVRDVFKNHVYCVSTNADRYFTDPACFSHRISTLGRFVAFEAFSVSSAKPGMIFRHDIQTGQDDLVNSNAALPTDYYKYIQSLDMTPDGGVITFIAITNSGTCVLVWNAQTATTTLVSAGTNGTAPPSGANCDAPQIDSTGRYVLFRSTAGNLVTNPIVFGSQHLYLRDLQAGVTKLMDVATNAHGSMGSFVSNPSMDPSARYLAFDSSAPDLVANDNNGEADIFMRDAVANTNQLISVHHPALATRTGIPGGVSHNFNCSADGRYAVFASLANGMVTGYTNRFRGIFLRDFVAQTNLVVSVTTNGLANANGASTEPVISGNGRYVAFTSWASNLVKNDTNSASDVFIRDLQSGTNSLVSANAAGTGSGYLNSSAPSISFDGRYVLFINYLGNLCLRDRTLATNYVLTTTFFGGAAMTPDGRYVVFYGSLGGSAAVYVWDSQAARRIYTNSVNLVAPPAISTNGQRIAFIASNLRIPHVVDWPSNADHIIGNAGKFGTSLKFSGDGRFLVYSSTAANVATATNGSLNVYVYDSQTSSNTLVSHRQSEADSAHGDSTFPDISADGRYVVYESIAPDLVPADNNQAKDIFLYDRPAGTTMLLSYSDLHGNSGDSVSQNPVITGDGQTILFQSFASDLATNDFNSGSDLFVLKLSSTNSPPTNSPSFYVGQIIYAPGSGPSGPSVVLTWTATPGYSYQVLYKDNLSDPAWQPLNGTTSIVGDVGQATDSAPSPNHRFYKIVAN